MQNLFKCLFGFIVLLVIHGYSSTAMAALNGAECGEDGACQVNGCDTPDPDCNIDNDNSYHPSQNNPPQEVTWSLTGPVTPTRVSGYTGRISTLGNANSNTNGLFAILSNERSDEPCYVAIGTENLNNATSDVVSSIDKCGPDSYSANSDFLHADYLNSCA